MPGAVSQPGPELHLQLRYLCKLVSTCCPDQLGSTPQTAPLVNKSCRTLCHRQRLHQHHGHWELQRSNPSLLSPQSLRVQAGVSGFPTVHCNMSLHAVVAGVITPQRPFAPAGVFGYHPHPWQYTADCQRCGDGNVNAIQGCDTWCEWVSRPTWANTPGCEQCTTEQNQDGKTREIFTMTFVEQSNHISMRLHGGIGAGVQ